MSSSTTRLGSRLCQRSSSYYLSVIVFYDLFYERAFLLWRGGGFVASAFPEPSVAALPEAGCGEGV